MEHPSTDLKGRTKNFALCVIRVVRALPVGAEGRVIGYQLLRPGTSMAANYRAARRARSRAEFSAKLAIALEEADESVFWLELIVEAGLLSETKLNDLIPEANQLAAILNASRTTAKKGCQSTVKNQQLTICDRAA